MPVRPRSALLPRVLAGAALLTLVAPVAVAAAATARVVTPPAPAPVTFGIQPAHLGHPDDRPYLSYSASPGAELDDQVVVLNYSDASLRLAVVAADGVATKDGSFAIAPTVQRPTEVGRWVHLRGGRPTVVVPPRSATREPGRTVVPFHLVLPASISPGDHFGGIAAVLYSQSTGDQAVRLEQRVVTRLYLRVSGAEHPRLSIRDLTVDFHDRLLSLGVGSATVRYRVVNTGNIKLGAHQQVVVGGWIGPDRTTRPTDVPLLFPGGSVTVTAVIKDVWPIIPDSARVQLLPVHLQGDPSPALGRVEEARFFWAVPWGPLLLLLLLLLVSRLRRRFHGPVAVPRHLRPGPLPGARDSAARPEVDDVLVRVASTPRRLRSAFRRTAYLLVALGLGAGMNSPARAGSVVPYDDPSSTGSLTLCDSSGHELREGPLTAAPFASLVVGATAAPEGYRPADGATATLYAHQPREGTAPGEWSGLPLTGAARFTAAVHPSTQVLPADYTLGDAAAAYPPKWQGLLQLRMILASPGRQALGNRYDTADIQVVGDRWRLVRGGGGTCPTKPTARAVAFQLGTVDATGHSRGQAAAPSTDLTSPSPATRATSSSDATTVIPSSRADRAPFGGTDHTGLVVGALLVLVLGVAGSRLLRRARP